MRSRLVGLLLGVGLVAAVGTSAAHAQIYYGGVNPYASNAYAAAAQYNYNRAYSQFLYSSSPLRTYSSLQPGYGGAYVTPFASGTYYQTPGYDFQRLSPFGLERYQVVPGYTDYAQTPFGFRYQGSYPYTQSYFVPSGFLPSRR